MDKQEIVNDVYKKQIWLNKENSPSTSNVVVYDGLVKDYVVGDTYRSTFLSLSDCSKTVKLHIANYDTIEDFIYKLQSLKDIISDFIEHLKQDKNETD